MNNKTETQRRWRVGIIGAGLQGGRRAPVLKQFPGSELVMVANDNIAAAQKLSTNYGGTATDHWADIIDNPDINIVIVCTPPHLHHAMSLAALNAGKHVLCEKPLARNEKEAQDMIAAAKANSVTLKCGFNHRHHPGIQKAREWVDGGTIGDLNFIRCVYGICGRPGYEKEWRADPKVVSGGQLMEQGIHAIDLFRWFLGEFSEASGFISTSYWKIAPLEDNAFALFRTAKGQVASLHSSLTQWKNLFTFELFGQDGYIIIEGLGGGYGTEKVTLGKKDFFGPFKDETTEFRGGDNSWLEEWKEFINAIEDKREPSGNGIDGLVALKLANAVYRASSAGHVIRF